MVFACITNGVVVNAIEADDNFVSLIKNQYDQVVRVDQLTPMPGKDWLYDGETFTHFGDATQDDTN